MKNNEKQMENHFARTIWLWMRIVTITLPRIYSHWKIYMGLVFKVTYFFFFWFLVSIWLSSSFSFVSTKMGIRKENHENNGIGGGFCDNEAIREEAALKKQKGNQEKIRKWVNYVVNFNSGYYFFYLIIVSCFIILIVLFLFQIQMFFFLLMVCKFYSVRSQVCHMGKTV